MKKITAISVGICFSALIGIPVAAAAQTCNQSIVATTADTSFIIRNDGAAIHNSTGLMWMRCSLGQNWDGQSCAGEAESEFDKLRTEVKKLRGEAEYHSSQSEYRLKK